MTDYEDFLDECARVLCLDGLLVVCEWSRSVSTTDGNDVVNVAPRACAFLQTLADTLQASRHDLPTVISVHNALKNRSEFLCFDWRLTPVPVGDWHPDPSLKTLGKKYRDILTAYAGSMRTFLEKYFVPDHVGAMIDGFISDLRSENRLVSAYYAAHARRL